MNLINYLEREKFLKSNNQVEHDIPPTHQIGRYQIKTESKDEQLEETDDKTFVRSIMTEQAPNYYNRQKIENLTLGVPSGYCHTKANSQTGIVTGCYYNTQSRTTFICP